MKYKLIISRKLWDGKEFKYFSNTIIYESLDKLKNGALLLEDLDEIEKENNPQNFIAWSVRKYSENSMGTFIVDSANVCEKAKFLKDVK